MATMIYSNRIPAPAPFPARNALILRHRQAAIDLRKSLARWENEGGAVQEEAEGKSPSQDGRSRPVPIRSPLQLGKT